MVSTLEVTVQRRTDGFYPVVAEYNAAGSLLAVRSESRLEISGEPMSSIPQQYGTDLGKALFRDGIRDAFAQARGDGVRVFLFIEAEELKSWRWEWLCGPVDSARWDFLSLDQRALYSIYLPALTDRKYSPIGRHDLRALVMVANPQEKRLDSFDAEQNVRRLQTVFANRIPCDVLARVPDAVGAPTLDELLSRLTHGSGEGAYTMLHLVCHGWRNPQDGETYLYLEQSEFDQGTRAARAQAVPGSELIERLARVRHLPYLVFLSTCESAAPEAEQRLGGFAQRLVRELGIPAVIGMTERVTIVTAHALAEEFYKRLLSNAAQYRKGEVDRALVEAYAGLAARPDVNVPALYSRLGVQPLFSIALDRALTAGEVRTGVEQLRRLFVERAPVLVPYLEAVVQKLDPLLDIDVAGLSVTARQEREQALKTVNELCQEVVEISFNALAQGENPPAYDARQPFRGLSPFRAEDREFFFGRETLVEKLEQKLKSDNFLPVLGPSGSGKSSLVLAGLAPQLKEQIPDLQVIDDLAPGSRPMEQLHVRQAKLAPGPVLYIVDQFEEVFTLCTEDKERSDFIQELLRLAETQRVVLTMRADFWGECAPYTALKERMQVRQELIAPLNTTELRSAMEQQARKVGLRFEADLINTMLDDVAGEPGAMPLLQHALLELWKRRHGRWLRAEEYRKLGGVKHAIAQTADTVHDHLSAGDQARMRSIFLRLTQIDDDVTPGEVRRDTRRRVSLADLSSNGSDIVAVKALVKSLADAVLVVSGLNEVTGEDEVEVAHEALIHHWRRLRTWIDEDLSDLKLRETVSEAAKAAEHNPKDLTLFIHRGRRLEDALALAKSDPSFFNSFEQRYLQHCKAAETRAKRLWRLGILSVISASCVAVYLTLQSAVKTSQDLYERGVAALSENDLLASEVLFARALQANDALLLRFFTKTADGDIRQRLLQARNRGADAIWAEDPGGRVLAINVPTHLAAVACNNTVELIDIEHRKLVKQLPKQRGYPITAAFDEAGAHLAYAFGHKENSAKIPDWTVETEGAVHIWDLTTESEMVLPLKLQPPGTQVKQVSAIVFSPRTPQIAYATEDGPIRVWDLQSRKEVAFLRGHTLPVWGLSFNPKQAVLASASGDSTVRLWNLQTSQQSGAPLVGHEDVVMSVAFNTSGSLLASGSADGTVRVWNLATREEIKRFSNHPGTVTTVAFQPDGPWLASACEDQYIRILDLNSGNEILKLKGYEGPPQTIAFSPGGLLTSGGSHGVEDSTPVASGWLRRWRIGTGLEVRSIYAGDAPLSAVAIVGRHVISGNAKREIDIRTLDGVLVDSFVTRSDIQALAVSRDSSKLAIGEAAGVEVWRLPRRKQLGPRFLPAPQVWAVAFNPDGNWIAFGSDRTVWVCNAGNSSPHCDHFDHKGGKVFNIAFSPNGQDIATAGGDNTVRLWNANTYQETHRSTAHTKDVWALGYDSSGQVIASGGVDRTIRIMSALNLADIGPVLTAHRGTVDSLAFVPNSSELASGSLDHRVLLSDWHNGSSIDLGIDQRPVWWVAVSPDGKSLASASLSGFIRIWNLQELAQFKSASPMDLVAQSERHTRLTFKKGLITPITTDSAHDPLVSTSQNVERESR